ncbi:hypothetical protein Verru16b_03414 [Lacunisphaera limnophila]|uniref:Cardiolipin synthase N-terminal domain-containing protein n=1 Tax=Lacunisphaera limnophila TaxID=1838286 RepID=A0A1D8AZJ7_9BACT|nr:hypothetical protein [Lacunisphaera limnophila]AOS46313.1 hypothetical protein Verru16b_03414 [Lacunisphaera limnophila]
MTLDNFLPLFLIAGAALMIANAIWGFRDGRRRGRSGILVAMLVMWTFPLGVLLWLLFRPDLVGEPDPSADPDLELKRRANQGRL